MKKEKKGLDSLNPFGRTIITLKEYVTVYFCSIKDALEHIHFAVFVISFVTKLQYIGFCHDKSENFSKNKVSPENQLINKTPQSIRNFIFAKVISPDKNRIGVLLHG